MRLSPLLALCAPLLLLACDGPLTPEPSSTPTPTPAHTPEPTPAHTPTHTPEPTPAHALFSRYSPTLGTGGATLRILTAFDPTGCAQHFECEVWIGDQRAEIVDDDHLIEAIVPRMAQTGPLCLRWRDRTDCGETFTALPAPLLYDLSPSVFEVGATQRTLEVEGLAFHEDSEVQLGWEWLPTRFISETRLAAELPAHALLAPGEHRVKVYSPGAGRCGATSEALTVTVVP